MFGDDTSGLRVDVSMPTLTRQLEVLNGISRRAANDYSPGISLAVVPDRRSFTKGWLQTTTPKVASPSIFRLELQTMRIHQAALIILALQVLAPSTAFAEFWCECQGEGKLTTAEASLTSSVAQGLSGWANFKVDKIRFSSWGRLWNNPDTAWTECKHCLSRCANERAPIGVCKQKASLAWFEASYRRE